VVELPAVQNLVASWWFDYDQGDFDVWPAYFAPDAHFSCRSDSGQTEFEEFIRADVTGIDDLVAWQVEHRTNSPYPLRHNCTNVHLAAARAAGADFRSYLFVTQVVGGAVGNLASGICAGTVREHAGALRFADLRVVLDFTDSVTFGAAARHQPA
jgi:hypothetical protein